MTTLEILSSDQYAVVLHDLIQKYHNDQELERNVIRQKARKSIFHIGPVRFKRTPFDELNDSGVFHDSQKLVEEIIKVLNGSSKLPANQRETLKFFGISAYTITVDKVKVAQEEAAKAKQLSAELSTKVKRTARRKNKPDVNLI